MGPLRRRSPGSWVISFVACLSAESWVVQSPSNLCLSLTLQSPTYYKHLQNGFQHLSIHFWIFFYTLEILTWNPNWCFWRCFSFRKWAFSGSILVFRGVLWKIMENWYRDNTRAPLEDHALALARWKDQKHGSRTSDNTWHKCKQRKTGNDRKGKYTGNKCALYVGKKVGWNSAIEQTNKKRTQQTSTNYWLTRMLHYQIHVSMETFAAWPLVGTPPLHQLLALPRLHVRAGNLVNKNMNKKWFQNTVIPVVNVCSSNRHDTLDRR